MIDLLITLLILVVVFAVVSYVLQTFLIVDPALRQIIMVVLGVIFLIWLLMALAGFAPLYHGRAWH